MFQATIVSPTNTCGIIFLLFPPNTNDMEKDKSTLDRINDINHINAAISNDEDKSGNSLALELAEDLILELPSSHNGRNHWLKKYGRSDAAKRLQETVL